MAREEILQEVTPRQPRLLRAERRPLADPPSRSGAWLLTFDAGRLFVQRHVGAPGLDVRFGIAAPEDAGELVRADEDEPWWALMGQPLVRAWALAGEGLELQFRGDAENPKLVCLAPSDAGIALAWGPKPS